MPLGGEKNRVLAERSERHGVKRCIMPLNPCRFKFGVATL